MDSYPDSKQDTFHVLVWVCSCKYQDHVFDWTVSKFGLNCPFLSKIRPKTSERWNPTTVFDPKMGLWPPMWPYPSDEFFSLSLVLFLENPFSIGLWSYRLVCWTVENNQLKSPRVYSSPSLSHLCTQRNGLCSQQENAY